MACLHQPNTSLSCAADAEPPCLCCLLPASCTLGENWQKQKTISVQALLSPHNGPGAFLLLLLPQTDSREKVRIKKKKTQDVVAVAQVCSAVWHFSPTQEPKASVTSSSLFLSLFSTFTVDIAHEQDLKVRFVQCGMNAAVLHGGALGNCRLWKRERESVRFSDSEEEQPWGKWTERSPGLGNERVNGATEWRGQKRDGTGGTEGARGSQGDGVWPAVARGCRLCS